MGGATAVITPSLCWLCPGEASPVLEPGWHQWRISALYRHLGVEKEEEEETSVGEPSWPHARVPSDVGVAFFRLPGSPRRTGCLCSKRPQLPPSTSYTVSEVQ